MLSKETLQQLSEILRAEYGQNLTPTEVFEVAQGLVGFFDNLAKCDFEDKLNDPRGIVRK